MTIVVNAVLPPALLAGALQGPVFYCAKILFACAAVAVLEVSVAKMRLFRSIDLLLFGFLISAAAFIVAVAGF